MTDRLFVYGTLAAGRPNEHFLADVPGEWKSATVTGTFLQEGWGSAVGYPGIVLEEHGGEVKGFLFSSECLAEHWTRLDEFEGEGYEPVLTTVVSKISLTVAGEAEDVSLEPDSVDREKKIRNHRGRS